MLKPKTQIIVSACAIPSFAFIALNRWATGQTAWAVVWAVLALLHCWVLYDAISARKQTLIDGDHHG